MTTTILTDSNNNKPWETIEIERDAIGAMTLSTTYFDNGTTRIDDRTGDQRMVTVIDAPKNLHTWEQVVRVYGNDGALVRREITKDTGELETQFHRDGDLLGLSFVAGTDQDVNWVSKDFYYNPGETTPWYGEIYLRNGTVKIIEPGYETVIDEGDLFDWYYRFEGYRNDGSLKFRTTEFDDGVREISTFDNSGALSVKTTHDTNDVATTNEFDNGLLIRQLIEDSDADMFDFQVQERHFDETGSLTQRIAIDDDGTGVIADYQNGRVTDRTLLDINDDQLWSVIEIDYNNDGSEASRTVYLDSQDLPDDIAADVFEFNNTFEIA